MVETWNPPRLRKQLEMKNKSSGEREDMTPAERRLSNFAHECMSVAKLSRAMRMPIQLGDVLMLQTERRQIPRGRECHQGRPARFLWHRTAAELRGRSHQSGRVAGHNGCAGATVFLVKIDTDTRSELAADTLDTLHTAPAVCYR